VLIYKPLHFDYAQWPAAPSGEQFVHFKKKKNHWRSKKWSDL